jgi:L-threonylcarbamoyladenylate synthase
VPELSELALKPAIDALASSGVIAYPTEAVYGFGCDPDNAEAVQRILTLKQRDPAKGLICVAASFDHLRPYLNLDAVDNDLLERAFNTWPGPVTWLFPVNKQKTHRLVYGEHDTLAVRVSAHPIVRALCQQWGKPLISTSANRATEAPCRDVACVKNNFSDGLDYIVEGVCGEQDKPTMICDVMTGNVLRAG